MDAAPSVCTVLAAWASTPFISAYCSSSKATFSMEPPSSALLCGAAALCTSAIAHTVYFLAESLWG